VRFLAAATLKGDPVLGDDALLRFRAVRFTPECAAIAPDGSTSSTPACPHCRSAWVEQMRVADPIDALCVGPQGIDHAAAHAVSQGWLIERFPLAQSPMKGAPDACLVRCTQQNTDADDAVLFMLTTRPGTHEALSEALARTTEVAL
jgi:hypothetical protein